VAASKFTERNRDALIECFAAGCSLPDAAAAVGINKTTIRGWLTRGRREEAGEFADFAQAVDGARERARVRLGRPMDSDELAHVVSAAARKGNTKAMRMRWEMLTEGRPGSCFR